MWYYARLFPEGDHVRSVSRGYKTKAACLAAMADDGGRLRGPKRLSRSPRNGAACSGYTRAELRTMDAELGIPGVLESPTGWSTREGWAELDRRNAANPLERDIKPPKM